MPTVSLTHEEKEVLSNILYSLLKNGGHELHSSEKYAVEQMFIKLRAGKGRIYLTR